MYKFILAIRYMLKRRISYLAFASVALCVFIVVVVMTVMTGLVIDFKQKNHRFTGDCVVGTESLAGYPYYDEFMAILQKQEYVKAVTAVIKSYALVSPRGFSQSLGVEILAVEPQTYGTVTDFGDYLAYHKSRSSQAFKPTYDKSLDGCVIGVDLWLTDFFNGRYSSNPDSNLMAMDISCFPITAKGSLAQAGTSVVNTKTFYYSDNAQSGLARTDGSVIYIPFEDGQLLCGMAGAEKRASFIHIKFKPDININDGCTKVSALWQDFRREKQSQINQTSATILQKVTVQSWKIHRRPFIAAMEKEQLMLTVMFILVGITTIFIILVVFYMIICHKSKDIGVLKSIGASTVDILKMFSIFAVLIGICGSAVGSFFGWLFLLKINKLEDWLYEHFGFQMWDRTVYAIGEIPNTIDLKVLTIIIFSAILACLIGALVPAWQAARLKPVETLQVTQL